MNFKKETDNGIDIVTLSGRFDAETAQSVEKEFDELCAGGGVKTIIVMTNVDYISSSMIRVLLKTLKVHKAKEGDMKLVGLQDRIYKVLSIAGIDTLFSIHKNTDEAKNQF